MAAIHVCNVAAITACVSESACLGLLLPLRFKPKQSVCICWIDIIQPAKINPWRSPKEGLQTPVGASL